MRTIKNLTVEVTYRVGLGNIEVSDNEFEQLAIIYDEGGKYDIDMEILSHSDAFEWLSDNIREADAYEWAYEIIDFEEEAI